MNAVPPGKGIAARLGTGFAQLPRMSSEPFPTEVPVISPTRRTSIAEPDAPRSASASEFERFLAQAGHDEPASLRAWLELAEAWKITKTLRECRGNRSAAARALGIGRRTLYAKMEKLRITPTWKVGDAREPSSQG